MAVRALNHLGGHAQVPGGLPDRYAALHQPGRGRVPESVRCDPSPQSGQGDRVLEPSLDRLNGGTVPLHEMRRDDAAADPPPHVGKQPRRNRRRRLPLVARTAANSQTIVNPLVKIDKRMSDVAVRRCGRDRTGPRSSVEADQDEPRQMSKRSLVGFDQLSFCWPRCTVCCSRYRQQAQISFAASSRVSHRSRGGPFGGKVTRTVP